MTRHIIDRDTLRDTGQRLRQFLRIDREGGMHPAVARLHAARPAARNDGRRMKEFLRIDRTREN